MTRAVNGDIAAMILRQGILLIAGIVFLIQNDQAEMVKRHKHRRAGADDNRRLFFKYPAVLFVFLLIVQRGVINRHIVLEAAFDARYHLRSQRDFRH